MKEEEGLLREFKERENRDPKIILLQVDDVTVKLVNWCYDNRIEIVVQKMFKKVTLF